MTPLDLVRLKPLMDRTQGRPEVTIGLIDGPVTMDHPDLARARIRHIPGAIAVLDRMLRNALPATVRSARRLRA